MLVNSDHIKTAILCWFRFGRQYHHIATEVGHWSADVVGADEKMLVEVEVKVSKSDFQRDFTKDKHRFYLNTFNKIEDKINSYYYKWIPNKFYFAVPEDLGEWAAAYLEEKQSPYGLVVIKHSRGGVYPIDKSTDVVRKAKYLHKDPPKKGVFTTILSRMSSALCIDQINAHSNQLARETLKNALDNLSKTPDIDPEEPNGTI